MDITFHGAAQNVTGSCHLIHYSDRRVLFVARTKDHFWVHPRIVFFCLRSNNPYIPVNTEI